MLCNALIQLHFDYAFPGGYPDFNEKSKKLIRIMQNKCMRFCIMTSLKLIRIILETCKFLIK